MTVRGRCERSVVFHADDFGMNAAVNQGILKAFREGLLTSTSLLTNAPAVESACAEWPALIAELASGRLSSRDSRRQLGEPILPFDLGIHLNLTQGRPLTGERYPAFLLDPEGNFPGIGKLFSRLNRAAPDQLKSVELELQTQVEWMSDRGLGPTHLNGHQYVELIPAISVMIPRILRRYAIPAVRVAFERNLVRNVLFQGDLAGWGLALVKRHYAGLFRRRMKQQAMTFPDRFFGTSHAGRIHDALLSRFLSQSSEAGVTEIGVHPGLACPSAERCKKDPWFDPLANLRPRELKWLCSSHLPDELTRQGIDLGRLGSLPGCELLTCETA